MSADTKCLFENDLATLEQADFCSLPGYLVLRLRSGVESLGGLSSGEAESLGRLLSTATAAIQAVVGADRVYCLSFCEVDRRLHFHLFPRTAALLAEYHNETGTEQQPTNGPLLFEWTRERFPSGTSTPVGFPEIEEVNFLLREQIRRALNQQ